MRVTFLVPNYSPSIGGAQLLVQRVAEGLVARHGHRVEVVTTDALRAPGGADPGVITAREDWIDGVHVRREPVARRTHSGLRDLRRLGRRLHVYRTGSNTMLVAGPLGRKLATTALGVGRHSDAVIGVGAPSATLWWAQVVGRRAGVTFVALPLLHISERPQRRWVLRALRRADGTAVATGFEQDWLSHRGVATDRTAILPPGCDPAQFPQVDPSSARAHLGLADRPTVGFLGRMAAHKGVDTLVDAMRTVWADRPEVQLLLAGERTGWDLAATLDRLGPAERDRVVWRESVSNDDKGWILAASDVVAFPSRSESFGMVTLEAWCARRPVVAGDIPAVRSLIRPGVDGDLVAPGDAGALADALSRLLGDAALREAYGAAGRHRAESEFAWDHVVDLWHAFLVGTVDRVSAAATGSTASSATVESIGAG